MARDREIFRLIDANANRAAEGLRTLEDVARLVFEDAHASRTLKELRHELARAVGPLPMQQRLAARDTHTDAGTQTTLQSESHRSDWTSVIVAACERVTQSLRCLEEFSKLLSGTAERATGTHFKALRYRAYDALANVQRRLAKTGLSPNAKLYLLIDCSRPIEQFTSYIQQLADAGVDIFQLRDKTADGGKLLSYAKAAKLAIQDTPAIFIVNDRVDIAIAAAADGVHVGQEDLSIDEVKRQTPASMLIGVSTHDIVQARKAEEAGADYIGCGPTFPSATKTFTEFPGTEFLSAVAAEISIPAFAIGGVDDQNVEQVIATGCKRIAVSNVIHAASDPAAMARRLSARLIAKAFTST